MSDKINVRMEFIGLCICGSKLLASIEPCALAHEPPVCEKFHELEPVEFLKYINNNYKLNI